MNKAFSILAAAGLMAAVPTASILMSVPSFGQGYGYAAPAYTPPGYTPPANYTPPAVYTPPANYTPPAIYPAANCYAAGPTYTPPNAYAASCAPPQQWVYYCQAKYGAAFNVANGYFKANDGYFYVCQ